MKPTHFYGWKKQQPDYRDRPYLEEYTAQSLLPLAVDLRLNYMPKVWDQGQLGSCTAHGIGAAHQFAMYASGHFPTRPSRLFIYWNERNLEGTVNEDAGAAIRDGIKVVATIGAPPERYWGYNISLFTERPPQAAFDVAYKWTALRYYAVAQNVTALKTALANHRPIVFGFTVYESFEGNDIATSGIMPMPQPGEQVLGGHCVLIVGYRMINGALYFICRNSWGVNWGDAGYFYMPAAFVTDPNQASDFWVISSEGTLVKPSLTGRIKAFLKTFWR